MSREKFEINEQPEFIPFDKNWLNQHLHLKLDKIDRVVFDSNSGDYDIYFLNSLEGVYEAIQFSKELNKLDILVDHHQIGNRITLNYSAREALLLNKNQAALGLDPFNQDFFVKYLNLESKDVLGSEHFSSQNEFSIQFKQLSQAKAYLEQLNKKGLSASLDNANSSLVFKGYQSLMLLKKAFDIPRVKRDSKQDLLAFTHQSSQLSSNNSMFK